MSIVGLYKLKYYFYVVINYKTTQMQPKINSKYLEYTQNWQDIFKPENAEKISQYLNSGFSFSISRKEYKKMIENGRSPEYIYYYFGLREDKLVILVIDDIADKEGDHEKILVSELTNSIIPINSTDLNTEEYEISHIDAMNRAFVKGMLSTNWINNRFNNYSSKEAPYFPLIRNSFKDLDKIFKGVSCHDAYHFFGLHHIGLGSSGDEKENTTSITYDFSKYMLDIIITSIVPNTEKRTHDINVSWPVGFPFCKKDLDQLYIKEKHSLLPKRNTEKK
jgi:hypothetical protein